MASSSATDDVDPFTKAAQDYWESHGGRLTVVRKILCETIAAQGEAFDAEDLLAEAQKLDPLISLSSVYRTLRTLEDAELVSHIDERDGQKLYRKSSQGENASSHIVCRDCGAVIPVEDPCLPFRESPAINAKGFVPEKISLRVEASCSEFAQKGSCSQCDDDEKNSS